MGTLSWALSQPLDVQPRLVLASDECGENREQAKQETDEKPAQTSAPLAGYDRTGSNATEDPDAAMRE